VYESGALNGLTRIRLAVRVIKAGESFWRSALLYDDPTSESLVILRATRRIARPYLVPSSEGKRGGEQQIEIHQLIHT
jgi:hypothetical protein